MKYTKKVVLVLSLGILLTACGKTTDEKIETKESVEIEPQIEVETEMEVVESVQDTSNLEPISVKTTNTYYEKEIEGKIKDNNLTVKIRPLNEYSLDGFNANLSDEDRDMLRDVFISSLEDIEKSAVLELDLMHIVDSKKYSLLYFDYYYGDADTKQLAASQLVEIDSDFDKAIKQNIEKKYIDNLCNDESYINADLDERIEKVLTLLEKLYQKGVIQDYTKEADNYLVSYINSYGYDCGILVKEFDSMMN